MRIPGDTERAMAEENVKLLRALYENWARGDFRVPPTLYDPHVVLVTRPDLPDAEICVGASDVKAYMRGYLAPLTDVRWTGEEFIEADGSVVVAVHQSGVGRESGIPIDADLFTVWTFRGRVVIRLEFFADRTRALEAVGLPA